ncbi:MAG: NADH-quinone oxidoreductase subunit NuoE [Asgard group archaeon]|nr:NADH-quinone oxidoreductase subunit NuoE [Asgard group archaeon]
MESEILKKYPKGQGSIIPLLQEIQDEHGYLPNDSMKELAEYLEVPLSRVYGVATFYAQFNFTPLGKYVVKICQGTACHVNGSKNIAQELTNELGIEENETSEDGLVTLQSVACLGCCSLAPVIMVNEKVYGNLTPNAVRRIARKIKRDELND